MCIRDSAYLREEWVDDFEKNESDFQLIDFSVGPLTRQFDWKPTTWTMNRQVPSGQELT